MKNSNKEVIKYGLFADSLIENEFELDYNRWNSYPGLIFHNIDLDYNINNEIQDNYIDTSSHIAISDQKFSSLLESEKYSEFSNVELARSKEETKINAKYNNSNYYYESKCFNDKGIEELLSLINNPSTDLNELLSDVLTAGPTDPAVKRKRTINKHIKAKRVRKSKSQIEALHQEYIINSEWQNEQITDIARKLNLRKKQVYKWYWDQKRKAGELRDKSWSTVF